MAALDHDLVSVVVPTRNRRTRLLRALASVRAQTWRDVEIIVVDDGSTDGTFECLMDLAARDRTLRVIRNTRARGAAAARNLGIATASGRWIAFLDDDDRWLPAKLEKQLALLKQHEAASAVSCSFLVKRPFSRFHLTRVAADIDEQEVLGRNCFGGTSTCLSSARVLHRLGGFDVRLPSSQDWDLWLRLFRKGPILVCDEPLLIYEDHLSPRISNDIASKYSGRRRTYFWYRHRMTAETRRIHLTELLLYRALLGRQRMRRRLSTLGKVIRLAGLRYTVGVIGWYASYLVANRSRRLQSST